MIELTFEEDLVSTTVSTSDFTVASPAGITITQVSVIDNVVQLTTSPALPANTSAIVVITNTDGGIEDVSGTVFTSGSISVAAILSIKSFLPAGTFYR